MESAFWAFLWVAMHNFQHTDPFFDEDIFHARHYWVDGRGIQRKFGGNRKLSCLQKDYIRKLRFVSEPLDAAIHDMAEAIAELYPTADSKELNVDTHFPELAEKSAEERKQADLAHASKIIQILDDILQRSDWPEKDWLPRSALYRYPLPRLPVIRSTGKRAREEADGEDENEKRPAKQARVDRADETAPRKVRVANVAESVEV